MGFVETLSVTPIMTQTLFHYALATGLKLTWLPSYRGEMFDLPSWFCFHDVTTGQPRFAPSWRERELLLRVLRPSRPVPPPQPGGHLCANLVQAARVQNPDAMVMFEAEGGLLSTLPSSQ